MMGIRNLGSRGLFVGLLLLCTPLRAAEPDWSAFQALLNKYVAQTQIAGIVIHGVDYQALSRDPDWPRTIQILEQFPLSQISNDSEKLAFYINAYNIFAIKMVLDHWPVNSIKDAGRWWRPVWRRPVGRIDGREVTLHQIEHEVLRPMGEPRIHFAIVCASLSCPDLSREVYRAHSLDRQLQRQVSSFLDNTEKGIQRQGEKLSISRIFQWFEEDFEAAGGVKGFLAAYGYQAGAVAGYLQYNWELNRLRRSDP